MYMCMYIHKQQLSYMKLDTTPKTPTDSITHTCMHTHMHACTYAHTHTHTHVVHVHVYLKYVHVHTCI